MLDKEYLKDPDRKAGKFVKLSGSATLADGRPIPNKKRGKVYWVHIAQRGGKAEISYLGWGIFNAALVLTVRVDDLIY